MGSPACAGEYKALTGEGLRTDLYLEHDGHPTQEVSVRLGHRGAQGAGGDVSVTPYDPHVAQARRGTSDRGCRVNRARGAR